MRWLHELDEDVPTDRGVPDAVAVFEGGELVGWDESAVHTYYAERGLPSDCDDECAARGHVESW